MRERVLVVAGIVLAIAIYWIVRAPSSTVPTTTEGGADAAPLVAAASDPTATGGLDVAVVGLANAIVAVQSESVRRAAIADPAGKSAFRGLPVGRYAVSAGTATAKVVVRANAIATVTLSVTPSTDAVAVSGTVHDLLGGVVAGAEVWIGFFVAKTDAGGAFEARVVPGTYELRVRADGYAESVETFEVVGEVKIDLVLHPASSLRGTVVRADGSAAGGARVTIETKGPGAITTFTSFANEEGAFVVERLPAGRFEARAATATEVGTTDDVNLPPASDRTIRIVLAPAATLSGTVRDERGAPLANAKVTLLGQGFTAGDTELTTGADGTYRFLALRPGIVAVEACADGHACAESKRVFLAKAPLTLDVKLEAASVLRVHVVDKAGAAVAGAKLRGIDDKELGITDARGDCTLEGLPARSLTIAIDHSTAGFAALDIAVGRGETKRTVTLTPGATVRGTVRWEDASPAAGVYVLTSQRVTRTGADGRYEHAMIRAHGMVNVRAEIAFALEGRGVQQMIDAFETAGAKNVLVEPGATVEGVDLVVSHVNHAIAGTVVGANGAPVAYAAVGAQRSQFGVGIPATYTAEDGSFTIEGLASGKFRVWAKDESGASGAVDGVEVGTRATVKLAEPTSLEGTVTDERGRPVPLFAVRLDAWEELRRTGATRRFADSAGHFVWRGIEPGPHAIEVAADGATASVRVDVAAQGPTKVAVVLQRGIILTGRLLKWPEMTPLAGIVMKASDPFVHRSEPTTADGRFRIDAAVATEGKIDLASVTPPDTWTRDVAAGRDSVDVGDLSVLVERDYGSESFGAIPPDVLTVDGHPIATLGLLSKFFLFARAKPESLGRAP